MPSVPRSANRIIATAVGLMVLVCSVVGVLGWRLVSQEEALVRQQTRDRLERAAEQIASKFAKRMQELDSWLSQNGPLTTGEPPSTGGAILVWLSRFAFVAPVGGLLYYPTTANGGIIRADGSVVAPPAVMPVFAEAERLEFTKGKLPDAAAMLERLTKRTEPLIKAEATFRLARVRGKLGKVAEALSTYDTLDTLLGAAERRQLDDLRVLLLRESVGVRGLMELLVQGDPNHFRVFSERRDMAAALAASTPANPSRIPYRLLSQFDRVQLLASTGRNEEAREHARHLVSESSSGRWRLDKATFTFYDSTARKIAGLPPPPPVRVAVAEQVERLWNEWQSFGPRSRSSTTRLWNTETPLVALVNTNQERLVALIADGDSLGSLGLDLSAAGDNVRASVIDEQGQRIVGQPSRPTGVEVVRALSGTGLPWQLKLAASTEEANTMFRARRNYAITAFSLFVLLVAAACYAIARGVLREAAAGRLQSDFVSAVSHEFRSPLTALRQLTELLAQGRIQDEARRRMYFDVLLRETSRLHRLVEDLLDFGRMDAGRRQYHFEPIDLSRLVEAAIHDYHREADASGHRVEFAAHSGPLVVDADREAFTRVVRNLLENAVKYSPDALTVWAETGSEERMAVLRIRDEGIGVPPEEQSRIFEKFVRGEAAKRACIQGTGIGLSMVKEIVAAHHGHVDLHSEVGRGSTFVVRLPPSQVDERRKA
jgi:signal transduction histidine kinase